MDWLMHAVEKDLGVDRRQQCAGPRPREILALVPTRWVMCLRERRVMRCPRFDSISEAEIHTYLQCSQAKLPPGWTRVCVQGLRKSKLSYRLARDPCHQQMEFMLQDSYVKTMLCVSQCNVRNLWREAHYKLVQPYAGASEQMHAAAVDAVRHALQKLFNSTFISSDRVSPSLSPAREKDNCFPSSSSCFSKSQADHLCPNVLPAECLLETAEMLYVILPYTQYSLHDIVSFSPAKLANSHAKVLFIIYQLLIALQACHAAGLSCGELSLQDVAVDEQLCSRLKLNLAHYEELGMERDTNIEVTGRQVSKSVLPGENSCASQENKRLCKDCFGDLKTLVLDWVHGRVSNFRYLMELNRLAGRREGDPNYHPVLPWVVDFTVPFGKFRDLRRSKFRLNKGDKQLDFTYEMTKEAMAAAVASGVGGSGVGGDFSGSVGAGGVGQPDHLHVPHHISDVLSDITYYVYKARQTPKSVLCSHVRSQWEPNEYPASMERMQSWTPDECIPEFYTDPSIFRSVHPDMPDLDVPSWCKSCEEFIEVHRRLLESKEVSQHLHHWIDLTFGYKLSGKEAVKAKNVCLHLVDHHTNLTTYGVVQLFDQPHPPRLSPSQYAPAEPPLLGLAVLNVPSLHIPQIDTVADTVDGMVLESTGCESSGWTMVDRDEELEQGMEALDSLTSTGSSSSVSCSVPMPSSSTAGGKMGGEHAALIVSQSPSSFPGDFTSGLGPGLRSAMLQRGGQMNKKHGEGSVTATNAEEIKIILPEGFNPLQPLEELEKLNNFLVKSLHAEVWHPAASNDCVRDGVIIESLPSLTQLYQRDMQAFGVLIAEIFYSSKLRGLKPGNPLRQRFQTVMKLCSANLRDVPLCLHHALETLLPIAKHSGIAHREVPDCAHPLLFKYDPICDGLPPPNPCQLLNSVISPFPFPSYFAALHHFIFSYHAKMETTCSLQGRDVVFHLWQQLETLLQGSITAEGLEILLPFILALMLEESTAVYSAWYFFEPISRVLGPRNANKYLLKPLINVYENPHCLRGRFYLYTDCFILQLIVRLGLQAFLSSLLPHVLQVITGFESCISGSGGEACKGERWKWRRRRRERDEPRRIGEQGAAEREGERRGPAEIGKMRGGHSVDRRGGRGGERRDAVGDRQGRNGGRSNSTGRAGAPRGHGLGFKAMEELSGKDPSVVAITLSCNPALRDILSGTTMRPDLVELLSLVLSKAFKSRTDRGTLQHLAGIIKDSGFFRTILPHYLVGMESEFNPVRREQYPRHLENILAILSEVLSIFPASSVQAVSLLLTLLQASINSLRASGVDIQHQMEESVEGVQGLIRHLQERSREGTLRSDRDTYALLPTGPNNPGEEEQQNFRTIPIYPTPEEFHQDHRPFLRPNLTSQRYTNTHLYLDTHFRLLREDFVRPLREGIQQLLRNQMGREGGSDKSMKMKRFDDIRVYFDTKLMVPKCTSTGLAYIVQFDIQPLKFVRWQNSKRLLYGSLVCLSCDNFESFLFATVSDRDPNGLQRGQVQITFTEESRIKLASIQKGQLFLMIETTAYFEAYRYVLEGLQEQEEDSLPFQRYIVECSTDVHPPAYLQRRDIYDLSSIADPNYKDSVRPFHSLEEEAWPRMEELGLDESQMRAFQLALTKELTIIQGPPGTGKTYVGLKIAQALLTNQDLWRARFGTIPMLVVCYTNHALDQFLEGIHTFLQEGIVRVGGRSNSEILKRFNLRELTRSPDFRRSLPPYLRSAYNEIYRELCQEERRIQSQSMRLECSLKGVLRESFLQRFISDIHWDSLHLPPTQDGFETWSEKKSSLIMEWLGLGSTVFLQRETENANGNEDTGGAEAMELDEEDLIEVAEEADLIQAERIIEDNIGPRVGRDGKKKGDNDEAVRALEELMLAMNLDKTEIQAEQSEEGWEMQRDQKKKMKNKIRKELGKSSAMTDAEESAVLDIWMLSLPERWRLYRLWVARYRVEVCTRVLESEQAYQTAVDRLADVKRQENLCVLKEATVIGMTTTGAAKFRKVLQDVRPRLVIVEEAAEVLEAHTITTLSEACQHLILIGDHQQLRPSATVYDLAKNFHLEMSMFERLVKMGLPFVRLNYQHRMRPDIARLLTPHIYSELENHPSVLDYENIKGLNTNLFFVEHNYPEEEIKDGKSHENRHEAMFVVALCRYLLFQDYKPEQITILTTYTGQLYCLRKLMPASQFTGVKVHVVDKYQGEENDIVLLSLVRSNLQGKVGFLNIPNRVCVALSRAKKGLYCIGNSTMLGQVKLWSNIFYTLREKDQVGNALTLCCQNHPNRQVTASHANDFKQAPEGGCTQPCKFRLDCGHVCSRVCHPYDPEHKEYKCGKKCQKILCDLGHRCTLVCHKACPKKCPVKVEKIIPQCQHTQMVPCHQDPKTFVCQEPCQKLLHCGHPCDSLCGEPCTSMCKVKVTIKLRCGHDQQDACFYKTQKEEPECRTRCEHQLKCGHACCGTCGKCYQGRFHFQCSHQCERLLICSHKCREPCTRDCPPCQRPCENCCVHSNCKKPCGQPCAPCIEPCTWQCPHQSCNKLCHEPCDRPPCTEPCDKTLDCGHPCIGLCGDKCPTKCRICNYNEVTEIFFGTEDEPDAHFIQLEDCGHIVEYTAMDTYMGMDDSQQANGEEQVVIKLKECPKCRTPIRKNLRYGSQINSSLAEIEIVKAKINGCQADIEVHKKALQHQWKENLLTYEMHQQNEYMRINDRLGKSYLTANDLWILENKMYFLVRVAKLRKIQRENMSFRQSSRLEKCFEEFVRWLGNSHQKFTEQQVFDLQRELQRLTLLTELNARCHMADKRCQSDKFQSEVQTIRAVLEKSDQFTEQDQHRVKEAMKELDKKFPLPGLGISEEERKMIVSAVKMPLGHWYKCPNGHVYLITDCGGAMESRCCPDCNATIGGSNHRLASGNQVASEMDGAQHPAWSETNNLLNFNQFGF